jgi:hypothetical protein
MKWCNAALRVGAHEPGPVTFTDGLWKTVTVFRSSLGPARTSPLRRPCSRGSLSQRPPRSARPSGRSASCSIARRSIRRRARRHDGAGPTPANVRPPGETPGTHPSTRHHMARGPPTCPRYMSVLAPSVTLVSSWTPVDMEGWMGGRRPTTDTTLVVADATMSTRTGARALHRRGLKVSPGTSSARCSHSGTARRPTSSSTLGNQAPAFGWRTTGLPAKPVAWMMTTSSSATSHCSWLIRLGHGWTTSHPTPSRIGRT